MLFRIGLFTAFVVSHSLFAKTLIYPKYKGIPIYAGQVGDANGVIGARARLVCMMAGYDPSPSVHSGRYTGGTSYELDVVVRSNVFVFVADNMIAKKDDLAWLVWSPSSIKQLGYESIPFDGKERFVNLDGEVEDCAIATACRLTSGQNKKLPSEATWLEHPYTQQCHPWFARSQNAYVFKSITCGSRLNGHQKSLIEEGPTQPVATTLRPGQCDSERLLPLTYGSVKRPEVGECRYNHWGPQNAYGPGPLFDESFYLYGITTDRIQVGKKQGPQCVQDILTKYAKHAIRTEYGMGDATHMKQAFCIDQVDVTPVAGGCRVTASGIDFMSSPFEFQTVEARGSLSGHIENGSCDAIRECWQSKYLSCENANFCPVPGVYRER